VTLGSHQATIGKSQVHLTPKWIIDRLGPFDLDPCAADPRPWNCAAVNILQHEDGLAQEWHGRVWLNPPFDRYQVGKWIRKLAEHGDGMALLHARTDTEWFEPCWEHALAMLFMGDRLIFCKEDGSPQTISDPKSKHFGKPANSGAPPVLVAFGPVDVARLNDCGIRGALVTEWYWERGETPELRAAE
jgi:hypothetical protein